MTLLTNSQQQSIFEFMYPHYKIINPIRLIELFAGIGAQAKALTNIGANFEHYRIIENNKFAIKSYNAIHNTDFKTSDIKAINAADLAIVDTNKHDYILTYSSPCTDFSVAGKMKGANKNSGTNSSLIWQVERLLKESQALPQILLFENVPALLNYKFLKTFHQWQFTLEQLGYKNYLKVLSALDYDVAQNRKRLFMISILGEYNYTFPQMKPLIKKLGNYLEPLEEIAEKYFLKDKEINYFQNKKNKYNKPFRFKPKIRDAEYAYTLLTEARNTSYITYINENNGKIRTLTPLESFRLMGFSDEDFYKCKEVLKGDAQLYKQAGNSIVVPVLEAIFKQLL